jgi:hypothetical protein
MIRSAFRKPEHDKHAGEAADVELGSEMHVAAVTLLGPGLAESVWRAFLVELAAKLGMTCVAAPAQWSYPMDGRGGNGVTIVQPITESFIAIETWPDHGGAYLFVCSCKSIDTRTIYDVGQRFGFDVRMGMYNTLVLTT